VKCDSCTRGQFRKMPSIARRVLQLSLTSVVAFGYESQSFDEFDGFECFVYVFDRLSRKLMNLV
jgi:hypothetical protein